MKQIITEALRAYRQYGRRIHVPQVVKTIERPDYVRMSSLGLCPLKAAREKLGIIPDIPELTYEQDDSKAWLMDRGNYTAAQIQEALMYYAMINRDFAFEPEKELVDHSLKLSGRADGVAEYDARQTLPGGQRIFHQAVLEIKDTEGIEKRSVGEPKLSYAYQVMAYMHATKIMTGYIVTTSKWGWHIYGIINHGAYCQVYDERDDLYTPPSWMLDWNNPEDLSWGAWEDEVRRQHDYLIQAGKAYPQSIILPPNDPLNGDGAWQCAWKAEKATTKKPGTVRPACPWAKSCHGMENRSYQYTKEDGILWDK